jgi:pimeloyl-ACP methyl ester carboxylesterase
VLVGEIWCLVPCGTSTDYYGKGALQPEPVQADRWSAPHLDLTHDMDYWDPAVTDGLARTRDVILFDNAGIGSCSGEVPPSIPRMGVNAIAFIRALGLSKVDILGFSIGGMVAQEIALQAPDLARKLILVGTGPRGADMSASRSAEIFADAYDPPEHVRLAVHFSPSATGRAAGSNFWSASCVALTAIPRSPTPPPPGSVKRSATTSPAERAPRTIWGTSAFRR